MTPQQLLNAVTSAQAALDTSASNFKSTLTDLVDAEAIYRAALDALATSRTNNVGITELNALADAVLAANLDRATCQTAYDSARADLVAKRATLDAAILALVAANVGLLTNEEED